MIAFPCVAAHEDGPRKRRLESGLVQPLASGAGVDEPLPAASRDMGRRCRGKLIVCRVLAVVEWYDRMRFAREKTKTLRSAVVVGMKVRCRWPTIPRLRKSFLLGAEKKWVVVLSGESGVSRRMLRRASFSALAICQAGDAQFAAWTEAETTELQF